MDHTLYLPHLFQSTFPRGKRLLTLAANSVNFTISIHVPAWGTTISRFYKGLGKRISIHVPAWGTTRQQHRYRQHRSYFNPRSRVGNDTITKNFSLLHKAFQSTFPRGERQYVDKLNELCEYFNPRSRVGNDKYSTRIINMDNEFQSTFPRGERHTLPHCSTFSCKISIHVPAWGTTFKFDFHSTLSIFQSTFPRGERLNMRSFRQYVVYFNPRSRVGNDSINHTTFLIKYYFNPRSRVGNDF